MQNGNSTPADCHDDVITLDNVTFKYKGAPVIDQLSFSVKQRDFVGLVGSNGAGKTTLLRMIVGLLQPTGGEIRLFGRPTRQFRDWGRVGYVPQKNAINPLFPATVKEVVLSGLYGNDKLFRRVQRNDLDKAAEAMHVMGIEGLSSRRIGQLSGGQQQRVFLARALINKPDLLILDEPTIGIDTETQKDFFHLIQHMHQQHHITFVMVSHDLEMILAYLGDEPVKQLGKLKFYVRHSHDLENCMETDLSHSLLDMRKETEGQSLIV